MIDETTTPLDVCKKLVEYFRTLSPELIDQTVLEYKPGSPASIAAHIAYLGGLADGEDHDYFVGAYWLAKLLDIEERDGDLQDLDHYRKSNISELLKQHGAGFSPFGQSDWPTEPSNVFEKLAETIEKNSMVIGRE